MYAYSCTGRVYATATATAPTVSLCLVPPAAPVLPVSGYAYVAPVPNRVYHCRYVAGSWVFRVRSLDTVQLDTDTCTGEPQWSGQPAFPSFPVRTAVLWISGSCTKIYRFMQCAQHSILFFQSGSKIKNTPGSARGILILEND